MKIFKIIFVVILSLNSLESFAQNTKISSYTFGEGLNFKNENGSTVKLQGYLQPYFESKGYSEYDGRENRYRMRRIRLRLTGTSANEKFSYRFQVDLAGADEGEDDINNYLLDAYISYDVTNRIEVSLGQRATYTDNRELFMSSIALQLAERSRLTSAFATIREFGLFVRGNFKTGGGSYVKPAFVLTNGDGSNVFGKDHGGLKIGGRVDFLPFGLFRNKGQFRQPDMARELTPKLVIGVQFSQNNGMSSRRGRGSGDILYLNAEDEETLPDYTKYGADFMFKYKGFSVLGEFVKSKAIVPGDITQRIRNDGTNSTTFTVDGVQDIDSYVRGRMVLGEAYNIQGGYLFKNGISVDARYTYLNADDNSFLNNATVYNRPKYYTLGVSKYLSRSYGAKIQASYTLIDGSLGINNNDGDPITGDENLIRVILTLAF